LLILILNQPDDHTTTWEYGSWRAQSDTGSITITVNGINDAPEITVPGSQMPTSDLVLTSTSPTHAFVVQDVDARSGIPC